MIATTLLLLAATAIPGYTRVLLPMHNGDTQGANGSVWKVEEIIFNQSDQVAGFYPDFDLCSFLEAGIGALQPGKELLPCEIDQPFGCRICPPPNARGAILYIPSDQRDRFIAYERVYEVNRDGDNHGVVIAAVHESNFRHGRTTFPAVPIADNFRSTLRIYNMSADAAEMTVRLRAADGTGLSEFQVEIAGTSGSPMGGPYNVPLTAGYAQIAVDPLLQPATGGPITVVVDGDGDTEYWAFLSVTSNTAQRVTVFMPSP